MGTASGDAPGGAAFKQHHKRTRTGIRSALPTTDDAWRRKLEKTKEANVLRAKTMQTFAKIKKRALEDSGASEGMHPDRQARLDEGDNGGDDGNHASGPRRQRGARRPAPFQKQREEAEQRQAEKEAREAAFAKRAADREARQIERQRHQKAMARARRVDPRGGDNQRRKLGRESSVLLDKVKRMMGQ